MNSRLLKQDFTNVKSFIDSFERKEIKKPEISEDQWKQRAEIFLKEDFEKLWSLRIKNAILMSNLRAKIEEKMNEWNSRIPIEKEYQQAYQEISSLIETKV